MKLRCIFKKFNLRDIGCVDVFIYDRIKIQEYFVIVIEWGCIEILFY